VVLRGRHHRMRYECHPKVPRDVKGTRGWPTTLDLLSLKAAAGMSQKIRSLSRPGLLVSRAETLCSHIWNLAESYVACRVWLAMLVVVPTGASANTALH